MQTSTNAGAAAEPAGTAGDDTSAGRSAAGRPESDRSAVTARARAQREALDISIVADLAKMRQEPGKQGDEQGAKGEAEAEAKGHDGDAGGAGEEESESKKAAEVPLDDAAKKKLEAEQLRDRKHREQLARDRAEVDAAKKKLEARETELAPKIAAGDRFEAAKAKGLRGLVELAEDFGLAPDDYEAAAQLLYARSPAAAKNPKTRPAAEAAQAKRELEQRVAAAEKRAADVEKKLEERDAREKESQERAKLQAEVDTYLGGIEKAGTAPLAAGQTDAAPLMRKFLTSAPARARALIQQTAFDLLEEGAEEAPTPAAVLAEAEKRRRADLAEQGIDPDVLLAGGSASKDGATVDKKKPSPTLRNGGGGGVTPAKRPLTGKELDADIIAGLRGLRSSGSVR